MYTCVSPASVCGGTSVGVLYIRLHEITKKEKKKRRNSKPNNHINNKSSLSRHLSGMTSTLRLSICLKTRQSETPGVVREKRSFKEEIEQEEMCVCVCVYVRVERNFRCQLTITYVHEDSFDFFSSHLQWMDSLIRRVAKVGELVTRTIFQ